MVLIVTKTSLLWPLDLSAIGLMRGSRVGEQGVQIPLKNHKNIGLVSNTGLDPLSNHKANKPAFNVGPPLALQQNAIYMALRWRADDGPLTVVFKSWLSPHHLKKPVKVGPPLKKLSGSVHGVKLLSIIQMQYVSYKAGGADNLEIGSTEVPELRNKEILVKVYATAVNRADVLQVSTFYSSFFTQCGLIGVHNRKWFFLISQPKHMLWVLKGTISMRRFFWAPKTHY